MDDTVSQAVVFAKLVAKCKTFPSLRQAAIAGGIDYNTLQNIIHGRRGVNPAAAAWVGYVRVPEMRFARIKKTAPKERP